jgi:hypothetical protein
MMSVAPGEAAAAFSTHSRTILALMLRRSSRLIPGLRATPAVTTTTADPAESA